MIYQKLLIKCILNIISEMPPKKTHEEEFDDKVLLDNREKALFWEIVVGSDGGKVMKIDLN